MNQQMLISRYSDWRVKDKKAYYRFLAEIGWQAIDMNEFANGGLFDKDEKEYMSMLEEWVGFVREAGMVVGQCHGPMVNPYLPQTEEAREHQIKQIEKCVAAAGKLGVPYVVLHPFIYSWDQNAPDEAVLTDYNARYLARACKASRDAAVCLENMPGPHGFLNTGDKMREFLMKAAIPELMVCLDTGHAASVCQKTSDFFSAVGDRIRVLHVHDSLPGHDAHLLPRQGRGDWEDFIRTLRASDYAGTLNTESNFCPYLRPEGLRLFQETEFVVYEELRRQIVQE